MRHEISLVDLFLREHAAVHTRSVAPADFNMDWLLDGLTDDHWRTCPHGFNSLAWLIWHMARVEDACVSVVVAKETQLFDEGWAQRLNVSRRDDGSGMSRAEVAELSREVDLAALRDYRDAVGRRTRGHTQSLWPERWEECLAEDDLHRAVEAGVLVADERHLLGKTREALLFWWGLNHTIHHLGQAAMLRNSLLSPPPGP